MVAISKSLKHKTIATAAAEEIRKRILGGSYPPGSQLRQQELAEEFGISRIPIREALLLLDNEGIVKIAPHRGAIVVELSAEEVEELFNMRILLEPFLLERSAPGLTPEDFRQLDDILERYEASIDELDIDSWNDLNAEFHLLLYKHARSPRMLSTVQNLLNECDRHTRIQLSNIEGDRERAVREHKELVRLCRERRYDEAAVFMRQHIDHIRVGLVALLNSAQEEAKTKARAAAPS